MTRSASRGLFLALAGAGCVSLAGATSYHQGVQSLEQDVDMRALPRLEIEWEWEGEVDDWRLDDGTLFVVGGPRLWAIDASSGEEIWAHDLERECSCSKLEILRDRVAAGIDGRAVLIDRASGALVADVPLGSSISALLPEPLVFAYTGPLELDGVVRLDEVSGVPIARYTPTAGVSRVERWGDRLVVTGSWSRGAEVVVSGLDLSLVELWQRTLPESSILEREGDDLVVATWNGADRLLQTLDPVTGQLSARRNGNGAAATTAEVDAVAAGLAIVREAGEPPRLLRPADRGGDAPEWQTDLPVVVSASVEWGDRVVLVQEAWNAAALVLVVDTRDGEILDRVAGWRGLREPRVLDDLLVAKSLRGLAAARLDAFGPSLASSMTVEESVEDILALLAGPGDELSPQAVVDELRSLGPQALPLLVEAIPDAGLEVVAMIADLAVESGYAPAAAPLAARITAFLQAPPPGSEATEEETEAWDEATDAMVRIAASLSSVAGVEEVPLLDRLLQTDIVHLPGFARLSILASLGRLDPGRAHAALESLRVRNAPPTTWWRPPSAEPWIEPAALEPEPVALETLWEREYEEIERLTRAAQSTITGGGDGRWILFPASRFTAQEYWMAPLAEDGSVGEAIFLGSLPPPPFDPDSGYALPRIEAEIRDGVLEVGFAGGERRAESLDGLRRDRDQDGLTDRVETTLGLDPLAADTDGDGTEDPLDFAPNGRIDRRPHPEEEALLALHETLMLLSIEVGGGVEDLADDGLRAFLADVPALDWRAGPMPTFVVDPAESEVYPTATYRLAATSPRPLEGDELAVELATGEAEWEGQETAVTYVMRSTAAGWVLSGLGW